jgi:carbamoyl-phosphate synthase large subunit
VPYTTTLSAASAAVDAITARRSADPSVRSLQEWHALMHGDHAPGLVSSVVAVASEETA